MTTLRQLRYFQAVARLRHFGRAAELCAVTQPALSMQVKLLEDELGIELVERRGNAVGLTADGMEVARRAEAILADVRDLADYGRRRRGILAGPLRLGIIPSVAPYILPRLLAAARQRYGALQLQIRETQTSLLLDELTRGDLDAALLALPVEAPSLQALPLFDDRFLVAVEAGAAHEWAGAEPVRSRLARAHLLLLEEGHCLRDQALQFCELGGETSKALGAASLTTILQLVAAGQGVTLLPELCAASAVDARRIALIRFPDDPPQRTIGLVWRRSSSRGDDVAALGLLVREAAAAAIPGLALDDLSGRSIEEGTQDGKTRKR